MHPHSQPLAPIPQSIHSPFQSPTTLSQSMPIRMSGTPDAMQSNETQCSSPPSSSVHIERPMSSSPPFTATGHSPNNSGTPYLPPTTSTVGFTKPAISSASSSLFFPHLSPAASLAAASSTAAFYSGLRNLQQFQQQQHAAAMAAALQANATQSGGAPPGLGSINSNSENTINGVSQISPPLFNAIPSLRIPTSTGFVPISVSPKCANDTRMSEVSCISGTIGGASPPRTSPRSISAFSVESNS
jgi:hypothetical protein